MNQTNHSTSIVVKYALCLPSNHEYDIFIKRIFRLAMVAIFVVAFMAGAIGIAGGEASSAHSLLEFGSNGKRNMLYDARQRPQSVFCLLYTSPSPRDS